MVTFAQPIAHGKDQSFWTRSEPHSISTHQSSKTDIENSRVSRAFALDFGDRPFELEPTILLGQEGSMDIGKYREAVKTSTESSLLVMRNNALSKDEIYLRIVESELDQRYPQWRRPKIAKGSDPTIARFRCPDLEFSSQVQAYVWIVNEFVKAYPGVIESEDWRSEFMSKGRTGRYFARNPSQLWEKSPHLVYDPSHYVILENQWYANTNLSKKQKISTLYKLTAALQICVSDWSFRSKAEQPSSPDALLNLLKR